MEQLSNSLRSTTLFFKKRLYKNLYEIGDRIINRRKNQKSKEVNKDTKEIIQKKKIQKKYKKENIKINKPIEINKKSRTIIWKFFGLYSKRQWVMK